MGRPKKYLTDEEKRLANNEKSRQYYRRLNPEIQRVRKPTVLTNEIKE